MKVSPSRKVSGYVRAMWAYREAYARLEAKRALLAPLETKVERHNADATTRRAGLTGSQNAEAERILRETPTRKSFWVKREAAKSTNGGPRP